MEKKDEIMFYVKKFREADDRRDRDEEMAALTKLIELDPYCETPFKDFYYNYYYNRGVLYGYLGQSEKAIADYTKAIEINPKHDLAWGNRGVCYSDLGDFDNAIWDITWCLKIDPESIHQINLSSMYYWRIKKNYKEGRIDKVIEDCKYYIEKFSDDPLLNEVREMLEDVCRK